MAGTGSKSGRGFAAMDDERKRDLAAKGGRSVPAAKRSFSQDRGLAAEAGRKGGGHAHGGVRGESRQPGDAGEDR